ncbi:hypothetical protein LINGRAHAP2_LOCUS32465 [Linum grandiflorum]
MSQNCPVQPISGTRHSSHRKCKSNKSSAAATPKQSFSAAAAAASNGSVQWLDLPKQLVNLMATEKPMMFQDVSSHCVTKSWQPSPPKLKCYKSNQLSTLPQLQLTDDHHPSQTSSTFPPRFIPTRSRMSRVTSTGWGLLPPWESDQPFHLIRRHSSFQHRVLMVLTGLPVPAFAYYRIEMQYYHSWKKHDSPIVDPNGTVDTSNGGRYMSLCNGVWLRRKLYALSLQGTLAVIEEDDKDGFRVGAVGKQGRAVPCAPFRKFRECLVESGGEVVLVFLVFKKCMERVDGVEVYRLDVGKLQWVRTQSLGGGGDRALFFGTNCCVSVDAPWEVGVACRKNCVYLKANYFDDWSEYDMEIGTILPFPSLHSGVDCS